MDVCGLSLLCSPPAPQHTACSFATDSAPLCVDWSNERRPESIDVKRDESLLPVSAFVYDRNSIYFALDM